jgi:hypothetical protein
MIDETLRPLDWALLGDQKWERDVSAFGLVPSDFNEFLFALVADDRSKTPVTVVLSENHIRTYW